MAVLANGLATSVSPRERAGRELVSPRPVSLASRRPLLRVSVLWRDAVSGREKGLVGFAHPTVRTFLSAAERRRARMRRRPVLREMDCAREENTSRAHRTVCHIREYQWGPAAGMMNQPLCEPLSCRNESGVDRPHQSLWRGRTGCFLFRQWAHRTRTPAPRAPHPAWPCFCLGSTRYFLLIGVTFNSMLSSPFHEN